MVATFDVIFDNGGIDGAAANQTDVDALGPPALRFKNADDATIDANDKLVVPGVGGTKYSMWKQILIKCSAADGHTMNNVAVYSDGACAWTTAKVDVNVALTFPVRTSTSDDAYELPAVDEEMDVNHSGVTGTASFFSKTSGEATDLDVSINEVGNIINAVNETCNYVVLQMKVDDTADPGDLSDEDGWFSYDEA